MDYSLHYRSPRMMAMDPEYEVSRVYNAQSWPTFVVVDAQGVIRFHGFDSDRQLSAVRRCVENTLKAGCAKPDKIEDGTALPAQVLAARKAPRDRSPRLSFDASGNPQVVYYSNRDGQQAIYLRKYNAQGAVASDLRISPAGMESYSADCVVDAKGTLWVAWCGRSNAFYDIFVQTMPAGAEPVTERLTSSTDDAMAPRLAAGKDGVVVAAYYKWAKLSGISRDRNIFARRFSPTQGKWSAEAEVSPPEPEVEDHTDPAVVIDGQGRAWVAWSYDYHPQLFGKPEQAAQPTIFAATLQSNTISKAMIVGATGKLRNAIDLFPSIAVDSKGVPWCAWDCSMPHRTIQLARRNESTGRFASVCAFGEATCSTPELSPASGGRMLLCWSERAAQGRWQGKALLLKEGQATAETKLEAPGDVLFVQAKESPKGEFWAVYEQGQSSGTTVVLKPIKWAAAEL